MIKLNEKLYINADSYCYTLQEKTGEDKNGDDVFKPLAYCGTLQEIFIFLVRYKQRKDIQQYNYSDIATALESMEHINQEVSKMLLKVENIELKGDK